MEVEIVLPNKKPERPDWSKNPLGFLHWHAAHCSKNLSLTPVEGLPLGSTSQRGYIPLCWRPD